MATRRLFASMSWRCTCGRTALATQMRLINTSSVAWSYGPRPGEQPVVGDSPAYADETYGGVGRALGQSCRPLKAEGPLAEQLRLSPLLLSTSSTRKHARSGRDASCRRCSG